MRLHIGHHFFGSGNIGDDLMLAGFLHCVTRHGGGRVELTCCSAWDLESQRLRFPQVKWLPYTKEARDAAVAACDAWVGVGDTPFQLSVGPWFLDHLRGELELCRRQGKRMFFIGVGVEEPEAAADQRARAVLEYASRVWSRDAWSAEILRAAGGADKVVQAADLAHVYLAAHPFARTEAGVLGYVLSFEDPTRFSRDAICELVEARTAFAQQRWLVQEVRPLAGSEMKLWEALPEACRRRLDLRRPDYANGSVQDLVRAWGTPSHVLTSRYHAALIAAWAGANVLPVERSGKVSGLVTELGLSSLRTLHDAVAGIAALARAGAVRQETLQSFAARAGAACDELLESV